MCFFFFADRRRHTSCALVTGVQTCALPILRVASMHGPVPLANVASVTVEGGPAQIDRYDRARNVTLTVNLQGKALGEVNKEIEALPAMRHLPTQVHRGEGGDVEFMNDLFGRSEERRVGKECVSPGRSRW